MARLDWLFVVIVIVFVIIRKIAEASRTAQQGPGSQSSSNRPDEVDISVEDIEEFMGRRRQGGTQAGQQAAGSSPAQQSPAFPTMDEEGEDLQETSDAFSRPGGASPPQAGASPPGTQGPAVYPTFLGPDREGARRPQRPPQARATPSASERERQSGKAEAPHGRARSKRGRRATKAGKSQTYESPIPLPEGLTPIQQAMVFAQIFGKPGGKYGNL